MSPVADTVREMISRAPEVFLAWGLFAVLPVLVPAAMVMFDRVAFASKARFAFASAAGLLGGPLLLVLLIGVPWFVWEQLLVPVVLDVYPATKPWLNPLLAFTRVLRDIWPWAVPLAWLVWLIVGAARARRRWRARRAG